MNPQPKALRLADAIDPFVRKHSPDHLTSTVAAAELRRLQSVETESKERILRLEGALTKEVAINAQLLEALVMGEPVERIRFIMSNQEPAAHVFAATERNKLAAWMMSQGYATGHGDTVEDLLKELEWQIEERIAAEREACAKACDVLAVHPEYASDITKVAAQAIRARGNT